MNLKDFQDLVEIQSLDREITAHQKVIKEHHQRVISVKKQRQQKQELLELHKKQLPPQRILLQVKESEMNSMESKIERLKENLKSVTTEKQMLALQSELSSLESKHGDLEQQVLAIMENSEFLEAEIPAIEQYLSGSASTLLEIEKEVQQDVAVEEEKVATLQGRVDHLVTGIASELKQLFVPIYQKMRFHNPLCFIENEHCNQCHFSINKHLTMMIEKGATADICPSCGRLLTPQSVHPSHF
ncbi:MAG: hypothetical protein WCG27_05280 [Pseudomonadota bacterium]